MYKKYGFTLVEMLLVVIIIGVLISIAIPSYLTHMERGKIAKAITHLRTLRQANIAYYMENGSYANVTTLEGQIGTSAMSNDTAWSYAINTATGTTTATRSGGTWATQTITLTIDDVWGGTYNGPKPDFIP